MAAVRPAGPEPTMTTLAWLSPSASGEMPLPPGCWLTRRSLVASAGAPSSTIEMLGKPSLVLSTTSILAKSSNTPRGYLHDLGRVERRGLAQGAHVRDHVAADELELGEVPDVAHGEDRVVRAGVGPVAQALDQAGRRERALLAVVGDRHGREVRALDGVVVAADIGAVLCENRKLVAQHVRRTKHVARVGVARDQAQRGPLAAAADKDRDARPRHDLRRVH